MLQLQPTLDARDGSDLDDSDASRGLLLTSTLHCPSLSDGAPLRDRTVQGMGCTCVAIRLHLCGHTLVFFAFAAYTCGGSGKGEGGGCDGVCA